MSDLQSKLGEGLNKIQGSLQHGKQKIQTVQEISGYKKVIQEKAEARANLLLRLGEETYKKIRSGEIKDDSLNEFLTNIASFDKDIYQAQKSIESLNLITESRSCKNCGTQVSNDDKFCGSCGQVQEMASVNMDQQEMVACPVCEEKIPSKSEFCVCCGVHVGL